MRISFIPSTTSLVCAATVAAALTGNAWAGPISVANSTVINMPSLTEQIYYRRYYHRPYSRYYRRGYYYDPTGAIVAGAAVGLIGAAAAGAYGPRYYYGYPAYGYPVYGYPAPYPYYGW